MNILVAEDNVEKIRQIKELLLDKLCFNMKNITFTNNKEDTIELLTNKSFNFLILDMSLPRYKNDMNDIKHLAGKDILIFMRHRRKSIPSIVITQHDVFGHHNSQISLDNLRNELMSDFSKILIGVLAWDSSSEHWKEELKHSIESTMNL
ncbi:MAG: hypothetical protein SPiBPW_30470 [Shewanella algae]